MGMDAKETKKFIEETIESTMLALKIGTNAVSEFIIHGGFKQLAVAMKAYHQNLIDAGFTEEQATEIVANYNHTTR
jgi:hypothetical protein